MSTPDRPVPVSLAILAAVSVVLLVGVAAGLVRHHIRHQHKPTSSEVRTNLKSLFTGAKAYFGEKDAYSDDMRLLGFLPEPGNRYSYFSAPQGHALGLAERERPTAPFQAVPADPDARGYRGAYTTFAETGCPLTDAVLPEGSRAGLGVTPGPGGDPYRAVFIAAAAANIDDDTTVDCWSIATVDRMAPEGTPIPAGVPYNELNDVVH
jgi:type IV pilus assembly protein PilA